MTSLDLQNLLIPPSILIVVGISLLLAACAGDGSTHMAPDELLASIDNGTAPVIVDVRTQGEYDFGHVPGAIHLPF